MARPREFDVDEVSERALEVFWKQGYQATTLQDLTSAMGLSKSSFYETFGSKHALFLVALDRYRDKVLARLVQLLDEAPRALDAVRSVFHAVARDAHSEAGQRGCFIGNSASEFGVGDPDCSCRVRSGLKALEDAFRGALERASQQGDLPAGKDARALARFLTASLNGLRLMAKAGAERDTLDDVVYTVLAALD